MPVVVCSRRRKCDIHQVKEVVQMVNVNKLRGAVVEHGFTMESLANSIGMDRATLYRKIANNGENFTLKEVDGIVRALSLTPDEGMRIFFAQNVA